MSNACRSIYKRKRHIALRHSFASAFAHVKMINRTILFWLSLTTRNQKPATHPYIESTRQIHASCAFYYNEWVEYRTICPTRDRERENEKQQHECQAWVKRAGARLVVWKLAQLHNITLYSLYSICSLPWTGTQCSYLSSAHLTWRNATPCRFTRWSYDRRMFVSQRCMISAIHYFETDKQTNKTKKKKKQMWGGRPRRWHWMECSSMEHSIYIMLKTMRRNNLYNWLYCR